MNNYNCPHLTGVIYNGYEECDYGKACDFDCEWVEMQKYKQALQEIKRIIDDNTEPGTITTIGKLCEILTSIYKKISEVENE